MKASYELISIAERSHVNPGEVAQIKLYITGYGDVNRNKLHVLYSVPDFLSSSDPGSIYLPIAGLCDDSDEMVGIASGKIVGEKELGDTGTMIHLPSSYFYEPSRKRKDEALPDIAAEGSHEGMAPIEIRINSDENTPPGDYEFTLTFSYEDGQGEIQQSQQTTTIHVNNWVEKNQTELRIVALALTLTGVAISAFVFIL